MAVPSNSISSGTNVSEADDDEELCPICIEPLKEKGETKIFLPCVCNYRICMFCVRRLSTEFDNRCPGCRKTYEEKQFRFEDNTPDKSQNLNVNTNSEKDHDQQPTSPSLQSQLKQGNNSNNRQGFVHLSGVGAGTGTTFCVPQGSYPTHVSEALGRELSNIRVVQKNLVYLVGLAPSIAKEETLRKDSFFGQYGKIIKVAINRNESKEAQTDGREPAYSAYITFESAEDAKSAIKAVNGFWVDDYLIKASFGTTKYCNMFLRGQNCNNPECLYLHELGDDANSFTKEEMQIGLAGFHDVTQVRAAQKHNEQLRNMEGARKQSLSQCGESDSRTTESIVLQKGGESKAGSYVSQRESWTQSLTPTSASSVLVASSPISGIVGSAIAEPSPVAFFNEDTSRSSAGWASVAAGNSAAAAIPPSKLMSGSARNSNNRIHIQPSSGSSNSGNQSLSKAMEPIVPKGFISRANNGPLECNTSPLVSTSLAVDKNSKSSTLSSSRNIPVVQPSPLQELRSSSLTAEEFSVLYPNVKPPVIRTPGPARNMQSIAGNSDLMNKQPDLMLAEVEKGMAQLIAQQQRLLQQGRFEPQQKIMMVQGQKSQVQQVQTQLQPQKRIDSQQWMQQQNKQ